jgi:hypothetical protein
LTISERRLLDDGAPVPSQQVVAQSTTAKRRPTPVRRRDGELRAEDLVSSRQSSTVAAAVFQLMVLPQLTSIRSSDSLQCRLAGAFGARFGAQRSECCQAILVAYNASLVGLLLASVEFARVADSRAERRGARHWRVDCGDHLVAAAASLHASCCCAAAATRTPDVRTLLHQMAALPFGERELADGHATFAESMRARRSHAMHRSALGDGGATASTADTRASGGLAHDFAARVAALQQSIVERDTELAERELALDEGAQLLDAEREEFAVKSRLVQRIGKQLLSTEETQTRRRAELDERALELKRHAHQLARAQERLVSAEEALETQRRRVTSEQEAQAAAQRDILKQRVQAQLRTQHLDQRENSIAEINERIGETKAELDEVLHRVREREEKLKANEARVDEYEESIEARERACDARDAAAAKHSDELLERERRLAARQRELDEFQLALREQAREADAAKEELVAGARAHCERQRRGVAARGASASSAHAAGAARGRRAATRSAASGGVECAATARGDAAARGDATGGDQGAPRGDV